jgi:hydrogenase expression/formation protein HypC
MCIGIPMQVMAVEPGHAQCDGRGERRRVRTALVGEVLPGDWLLVFIDSAQERISAERALEVDATLDLLGSVHAGDANAAFALPSRMNRDELLVLSGQRMPSHPEPLENTP